MRRDGRGRSLGRLDRTFDLLRARSRPRWRVRRLPALAVAGGRRFVKGGRRAGAHGLAGRVVRFAGLYGRRRWRWSGRGLRRWPGGLYATGDLVRRGRRLSWPLVAAPGRALDRGRRAVGAFRTAAAELDDG
ncbi:MAG: hypothetical protein Kow0010_06240 [Dehalococcoidia bacterium]